MDKKSKFFFLVFFLVIVSAIGVTYYRYMVARDYMVQAETECDPYTEACFVSLCDASAGEECTGDPAEDTSYYKLIKRNAKYIPACDPVLEGCDALICPAGERDCEIIGCDPTVELEGTCSDPVVYTGEHPIDEEEAGEDGSEQGITSEEEAEGDVSVEPVEGASVDEGGPVTGIGTEKQEGGL